MEKVSKEVDEAAEKRRAEARAQAGGRGKRPEKYNTYGLPVQEKTVYPEGINLEEYDVIGQDETNVLHLEPQRLWVEKVITHVLFPLYESQREAVLAGGYVQIDEVPWNIADRKGQSCRKGYAWQFRDVSEHPRGTWFYYHKGSRAGEIPRTQLRGYQGAIQNDGYKVYNEFENVPGITSLACMAHIRRKFVDAQKSNPLAGEAVKHIATLYTLEENLKAAGATAEEIRTERQRLALPMLDGLEVWMQTALMTCTPKDPLAVAIKYALSLWPRVKRYTENGNYHIDSNPVEQGQRPSVLGRKNYLFSQNDRGAEDNAIFYTFMVSCQTLGVNPYQWLKDILERIRPDMDEADLIKLLPYNYQS